MSCRIGMAGSALKPPSWINEEVQQLPLIMMKNLLHPINQTFPLKPIGFQRALNELRTIDDSSYNHPLTRFMRAEADGGVYLYQAFTME
jgi:hypothetical protein